MRIRGCVEALTEHFSLSFQGIALVKKAIPFIRGNLDALRGSKILLMRLNRRFGRNGLNAHRLIAFRAKLAGVRAGNPALGLTALNPSGKGGMPPALIRGGRQLLSNRKNNFFGGWHLAAGNFELMDPARIGWPGRGKSYWMINPFCFPKPRAFSGPTPRSDRAFE